MHSSGATLGCVPPPDHGHAKCFSNLFGDRRCNSKEGGPETDSNNNRLQPGNDVQQELIFLICGQTHLIGFKVFLFEEDQMHVHPVCLQERRDVSESDRIRGIE